MEDLPSLYFMFFDRYEMHIQAFVDFMNGKLIIFNPHLRKLILRICTQTTQTKIKNEIENNRTNMVPMTYIVSENCRFV